MNKEKCTAIILAAGSGRRMHSQVPKQFLELKGRPLIYYSLACFQKADCIDEIILVTGRDKIDYCRKEIVEKYQLSKVRHIAAGGNERYDSVYAGLAACSDTDYVFIHDGARPFVTEKIILDGLETVKMHGCAIAGMPSKDTIKIADPSGLVRDTPDRSLVWNVQTPQIFSYSIVREAYDRLFQTDRNGITDDAMVVERLTEHEVYMYKASYTNIKITTPDDLEIAEKYLIISY